VAAERVEIVFGTHMNGEPDAPWFSAHAFLSGTSFETRDGLRETAAMAATAYGKIRDWKFSETEQDDPISRASC
jgi:hypothetical protein